MTTAAAGAEETSEPTYSPHEARLITVIGIFKCVKGTALLAAAVGALELLGKDIEDVIERAVELFRLAPDSHLVNWLYDHANSVTDGKLEAVASVGAIYGVLLCTEGYGLLRRRKWAERLVVVGTLIPVPYELYEIVHDFSFKKVAVLALNLAIVAYLVRRRKQFTTGKQRKAAREAQLATPAT